LKHGISCHSGDPKKVGVLVIVVGGDNQGHVRINWGR